MGDAPGDKTAADTNGVWYYPILVRHEAESWRELREEALGHLCGGTYKAYGAQKAAQFIENLGG